MEIKALTVNGKQVTLAVFRQLYEEPLYDPLSWNAFGTPWCRVNYHPDRCDRDDAAHEHVVWQKGDELRRARVNRPSRKVDAVPRFEKGPDDEIAVCVACGTFNNAWITSVVGTTTYGYASKSKLSKPNTVAPAAYVAGEFESGPQIDAKLFLSSAKVADLVKGYGSTPHPDLNGEHRRLHPDAGKCSRTAQRLSNRLISTRTWLEGARERWDEVLELPQVFIAL
ncbi:hypothetical protein [Nonomuraea sp. NPDC001699]